MTKLLRSSKLTANRQSTPRPISPEGKHDAILTMAVDSNTGSFDTHSVKVLVRSHYPFYPFEMARPPLLRITAVGRDSEEGHRHDFGKSR